MKFLRHVVFILLMLPAALSHAQNIDYNKIILPEKVVPNNFEERLIQLAWKNHPSNKMVQDNVFVAEKEKRLAKWRWLDDIYANGNLNEFTLKKQATDDGTTGTGTLNQNLFYPRYNIGLRLSLGTFFNIPVQTKIASGKLSYAEHEVDQKKLTVREEILGNVAKLKQYYKFIKLRKQIREDFFTMYKDAEKKFSTGEITIERYRTALQAYYDQSEQVVEAQTNFDGIRYALESLIGVELTEVEGYREFTTRLDNELKSE